MANKKKWTENDFVDINSFLHNAKPGDSVECFVEGSRNKIGVFVKLGTFTALLPVSRMKSQTKNSFETDFTKGQRVSLFIHDITNGKLTLTQFSNPVVNVKKTGKIDSEKKPVVVVNKKPDTSAQQHINRESPKVVVDKVTTNRSEDIERGRFVNNGIRNQYINETSWGSRLKQKMENPYATQGLSGINSSIQDFFYSRLYPDNENKRHTMPFNVKNDLDPFCDFLQRSIDSIENSKSVGADIRIPEKELLLFPVDSLISYESVGTIISKFSKPEQNVYKLEFEDELLSTEIEDIIINRKDSIWKKDDYVEIVDSTLFIRTASEIENGKKAIVWFSDDSNLNAKLFKVDFTNKNDLRFITEPRVSIMDIQIDSEGNLIVSSDIQISNLSLFGESLSLIDNSMTDNSEKLISFVFEREEKQIIEADTSLLIVKGISPNKVSKGRLYVNGKLTNFDICTMTEIGDFLKEPVLKFSGNTISCDRSVIEDDKLDSLEFSSFHFQIVQNENINKRLRLTNRQGQKIGRVIELIEDEEYKNDIYSNLDIFFAENTSELTDDPNPKHRDRRIYQIGWVSKEFSLMEIAYKNGKSLEPVFDDNLPDKLYVVSDTAQLKKQMSALNRLMKQPLPEHSSLLELTEFKKYADWSNFEPSKINQWYVLTDLSYAGCQTQRNFVEKALSTPDFAFLDGPPGSGKTTTILEIITQAVMRGEKVMLAASTNAAVDNILERIPKLPKEIQEKIFAVRIGSKDAISEKVDIYNIYNVSDQDLQNEIVSRANVVCSTIFGILKHPEFKLNNPNLPAVPLYDYLIIDEASKTTFQDFLVPAVYAKHWIFSGDLKQLTPYTEQEALVSALEENKVFTKEIQTLTTIFSNIAKNKDLLNKMRLCFPLPKSFIKNAHNFYDYVSDINVAYLESSNYMDFIRGGKTAIEVFGSKILFIEDDIYNKCKEYVPEDFVPALNSNDLNIAFLIAQNEPFYRKKIVCGDIRFNRSTCESIDDFRNKILQEVRDHSWANEIVWRLCRVQELFLSKETEKIARYEEQIKALIPEKYEESIHKEISLLRSIALPSVLQLLQNGIRDEVVKNKKATTLNSGFRNDYFQQRHEILEYQHRMHPEISKFSKENLYSGTALQDPEKISAKRSWTCDIWNAHSIWIDVSDKNKGSYRQLNNRSSGAYNFQEVNTIANEVEKFMEWTEKNPNPELNENDKPLWSVAILTYYRSQERKLKAKIKELFGQKRDRTYYKDESKNIELKIFTVDKFQGQEADVVFLSMVKTGNATLGFMDSPNRLNVALTRAKFQRIIVGNRDYFRTKGGQLLKILESSIGE